MGIHDDDVAKVREATDIVALASEHLALKRVGRRFTGLCPFHTEKSPSFSINPELGLYFCFGCQARGDAITFVREVEHLDFVEAVERLAARAGITLHYDNENVTKDRSRKARLHEVVGAAVEIYHELLLHSDDAGLARRYLRSRGFEGDVARQFSLGWAPDDFDVLSGQLQRRKFKREDIADAGLAFVNRANKLQDQFRGRLLFPIYDSRGEPVGFGGRSLTDQGPKYKNSPETPIYQKSRLLYGLNWAKGEIVAKGEVVICEGYTDVMAFVLAGAPHAVATCGTALADDHFQILKNLARKIILAYDADAAGQAAAERCYQWEHRFEVQFRVADLPAGRDPADVWKDDPARLIKALDNAQPFLQFRLDRLLGAADLSSLEGRGRAGEAGAVLIAEHPSELVRDQYVMQLADTLTVDADGLRALVQRASAGGARERARPDAAAGRVSVHQVDRRELDVLRWAIHQPELVVDWLDASLFADPVARDAFEHLASVATFHEALENSEGETRSLLERLAVEEEEIDPEPDTVGARLVVNMAEPAGQRLLAQLLRNDHEHVSEVKQLLDKCAHGRANGDWAVAREAGLQLVASVVDHARDEGNRGVIRHTSGAGETGGSGVDVDLTDDHSEHAAEV